MKTYIRYPFRKLNFIFITCIIITILCFSFYLFYQSNQQIVEENLNHMAVLNQQMVSNIELNLELIQEVGIIHIINQDLNRILLSAYHEQEGDIELAKDKLKTEQTLAVMMSSDNLFENITYFMNDKIVIQAYASSTETLRVYKEGKEHLDIKGINLYSTKPLINHDRTIRTFHVVKKIYGISNYTVPGFIVLEINFESFADQFDKVLDSGITNEFFIYTKEGEVIYTTTESDSETINILRNYVENNTEPNSSRTIDSDYIYGNYVKVGEIDWTIVQYHHRSYIKESSISKFWTTLMLFIISVMVITLIAEFVFIKLETGLREYINRTYLAEIRYKETELEMLQNQINPHFLYNTLNLISGLAVLKDVDEIYMITQNLSDLFRYNVKGDKLTTVNQEMLQAKKYIMIQKYRHQDLFDYEIIIDEEIRDVQTIKMILQPLVENAVEHGLKNINYKGKIVIKGFMEKDKVILSVEDNGNGFCTSKLNSINKELKRISNEAFTDHKGGIGIFNVHRRLHEYYGEQSGLKIESVENEYSRISIVMKIDAL